MPGAHRRYAEGTPERVLDEAKATLRRQKRFEAPSKRARLRQEASVEDVDFRATRGLDRDRDAFFGRCPGLSVELAREKSIQTQESP